MMEGQGKTEGINDKVLPESDVPPPYTRFNSEPETRTTSLPPSNPATSEKNPKKKAYQTLDWSTRDFMDAVERTTREEVKIAEKKRRDPKYEGQEIKAVSFYEHMSRKRIDRWWLKNMEEKAKIEGLSEARGQWIKEVEEIASEYQAALFRAQDRYMENCERLGMKSASSGN